MSLPIFTIQSFSQTALQPAGAVFAQRVESVSMARNFLAGITGVVGGRNTIMEKKMNDLTKGLMEELQLQVQNKYPNAVALVDVKLHFSDIGKDDSNMFLAGQASATALIKRNKQNTSQPLASAPIPSSQPLASAPIPSSQPFAAPAAAPAALQLSSQPAAPAAQFPPPNLSNAKIRPYQPLTGGKYKTKLGKSRKNRNT